jgi:hypothetical protein
MRFVQQAPEAIGRAFADQHQQTTPPEIQELDVRGHGHVWVTTTVQATSEIMTPAQKMDIGSPLRSRLQGTAIR